MENATVNQPGTVEVNPPSTVLNPDTVKSSSGGGRPDISEKGNSIQDVLESESKRLKEEDAKADKATREKADKATDEAKAKLAEEEKAPKAEKPEKEAKADPEEKPAEAKTAEGEQKSAPEKASATERSGQDERQSEGRKHSEPPARFLPEARTKWANVPNEVKAEVHRVAQEYEGEIQKSKAAVERYESIREFDEIAKGNGRELKDSLAKVVEIENNLARNPISGLDQILREIGPRKADGTPFTLMEVARHIVQNPQAYQTASQPQMQQPAPQPNREIEALRAEINMMKAEQTVVPIIKEFAGSHPDYAALEPQIEKILQSGIINQIYGSGLSPQQRLAEAYRMAGGSSPSQSIAAPEAAHSEAKTDRPVNPDAGKKSVRGAPADGNDTTTDEPETDIREMLRKEMRKIA